MENMVMINSDFWKAKRVLLTGHTGFKGCWLLLLLQHLGANVWTYSLDPEKSSLFTSIFPEPYSISEWHHEIGDLSNLEALKKLVQLSKPDIVFHLAAQSLVRPSYRDPIGTWNTNVIGSLHLLESLRLLNNYCSVVIVTTDKVYENREWCHGYREVDRLGGHDPYSSSKAALELAVSSWRSSFCGTQDHQTPFLRLATARAGNVIGGGDWAVDRIVPDAMRALANSQSIYVRNPSSTRPWQHVIEPLSGYLRLAEVLHTTPQSCSDSFNFGPTRFSNRTVEDLVSTILEFWPGEWHSFSDINEPHEAKLLHLQIDKAYDQLRWQPMWDFSYTVARTVDWYRSVHNGAPPLDCCLNDITSYLNYPAI